MNRELVLIVSISLLSALAGMWFYLSNNAQTEYLSSSEINATNNRDTNNSAAALSFDDIVLNDLDNKPQFLTQWEKPILILNFWAPWCAPCRREIPALIEIQNSYSEKVQIVGLSFDNNENVRSFSQEYAINYPLLIVNKEAALLNRYFGNQSGGLPFTVILDQNRNIQLQHSGEITEKSIQKQITALL
mgnify:CR=1 FL=1